MYARKKVAYLTDKVSTRITDHIALSAFSFGLGTVTGKEPREDHPITQGDHKKKMRRHLLDHEDRSIFGGILGIRLKGFLDIRSNKKILAFFFVLIKSFYGRASAKTKHFSFILQFHLSLRI